MRRGFCPGAWLPMQSGDGLLVRVRAPRGRLKLNQIRGLAAAAQASGNGLIELTRRGNLQLRGVTPASLPDLQAELVRLQLAAATPAAEQQPALSVCPFDGLDPRCPSLELVAGAVESLFSSPELTRSLSPKFSLLVSGGSSLFDELQFDLELELLATRPDWARLSVAGTPLGACRAEHAASIVRSLLVWLGTSVPEHARMSQLLEARGAAALAGALAPQLEPAAPTRPWPATWLGFQRGTRDWFGCELPFGSLEARDWLALAELAEGFGSGEIRLLPTRAVLLPDVRAADAGRLAELARAQRFIVERPGPWLRLLACSGAPACRSAHGETRSLASELAALVAADQELTLHVSGCEKSCAWNGPTAITVLHGADGPRLGFGASVAETARTAPLDASAVRQRIAARFAAQRPPALQHSGELPA
jgi:precorrin-3B synthase